MYKKSFILIGMLALLVILAGCTARQEESQNGDQTGQVSSEMEMKETDKALVITTLFPQYDFVRQIAGDKVDVKLLVPPGVEAHAYEPTPQDIVSVQKADLFIYTGEAMEPWAHKVIDTVGEAGIVVVEAGQGLFDITNEVHDHDDHEEDHEADDHDHEADDHDHEADDHDHDHEADDHDHDHEADDHDHEADEHDHGGVDPHVWLDPIKAQYMVEHVLEGLIEIAPEHEESFRMNAKIYMETLNTLHHDFEMTFEKTKSHTIMSGGHFAFGHFINRYGLEYESPYEGFAPDAEPTPKKIAKLIEAVRASETRAIFYEELVDPKVARIVAEETEAEMLMLHAAHNVSKEELESGVTYIEIMRSNLENLKIGLNYQGDE
ncbi:metal ABC transporter solute-binding protein, Zn/Mn family [Fusibacter sp. JL216-2]|uniref:metal ABC transporter solute-binding protein, Zn/Mn family n=1 Tax=Fusibacter sp. JL216-2 TaxID=3071453 RepID=UPI003D3449B8